MFDNRETDVVEEQLSSAQSNLIFPTSQTNYDFKMNKFTALELKDTFLNTGCPDLNRSFNGGIPGFGLTEFVGPSGTGKTQLALQLSLTVQMPLAFGGLDAGAVYISTESAFPSKRLMELSGHFKSKFQENLPDSPMENIIVEHVADTESLSICVNQRLPKLIKERKIGLVVLDSIAAIFRSEYDNNYIKRAKELKMIGKALHDIASRNKLVLVVINQVSAAMYSSGNIPSLGLVWRNFVTTRIQFNRNNDKTRYFDIPFSPYIPLRIIPYEIDSDGVKFTVIA